MTENTPGNPHLDVPGFEAQTAGLDDDMLAKAFASAVDLGEQVAELKPVVSILKTMGQEQVALPIETVEFIIEAAGMFAGLTEVTTSHEAERRGLQIIPAARAVVEQVMDDIEKEKAGE